MDLSAPLGVLVVVPHATLRSALGVLIGDQPDMRLVGSSADVDGALHVLGGGAVEVVVLDGELVRAGGRDTIVAIRRAAPLVRVLLLTEGRSEGDGLRGLTGLHGRLMKNASSEALIDALRVVASTTVIAPAVAANAGAAASARMLASLDPTDRELLRLLVLGYSTPVIQQRLRMPLAQVDQRRLALMGTLRAGSRAQLVRFADEAGLIHTAG